MYLLVTNNCESYTLLQIIYLIKVVLQIISIAVPVILIVQLSIKFFKAMTLGEEAIRKVTSSVVKTVIPAILIFFVPFIITFAFSLLGSGDFMAAACWDEATYENVQNAKTNELIARYKSESENIVEQLTVVVEKLSGNITDEEQNEVNEIEERLNKALNEKNVSEASSSVKDLKKIYRKLDTKYKEIVWEDIISKIPKITSISGLNENIVEFIMEYEGNHGYCDSSHTTYKAIDTRDGTITAGYGITNYTQAIAISLGYGQYFPMSAGDCVPVTIFDDLYANTIKSHQQAVIDALAKNNIMGWTQNQIDALTSFSYNAGSGSMNIAISRYASGGNEALWTYMSSVLGPSHVREGLRNRRNDEWQLYLNGDYNRDF